MSITFPSKLAIFHLSRPQRAMIVAHAGGQLAIKATDPNRTRNALVYRRMLYLIPNRPRPLFSALTVIGRYAAAVLLAEYAESLVRAGALEPGAAMEALKRLKQAETSENDGFSPNTAISAPVFSAGFPDD